MINFNGDVYTEGEWTNKNIAIELTNAEASEVSYYEWSTQGNAGFTSEGMSTRNGIGRIRFESEMNQTIYFRAVDLYGNKGAISSIQLNIDKTAPSGKIYINEVYKNAEDVKYTNVNAVTIQVTAQDNYADASSMKVAFINENDFSMSNLNSEIVWMDYEALKEWNVSNGDGLKKVYVIFKDAEGNQSVYLAQP